MDLLAFILLLYGFGVATHHNVYEFQLLFIKIRKKYICFCLFQRFSCLKLITCHFVSFNDLHVPVAYFSRNFKLWQKGITLQRTCIQDFSYNADNEIKDTQYAISLEGEQKLTTYMIVKPVKGILMEISTVQEIYMYVILAMVSFSFILEQKPNKKALRKINMITVQKVIREQNVNLIIVFSFDKNTKDRIYFIRQAL